MAYHDLGEGRQALAIHFVDEASRFHIADAVKEGRIDNTGKDQRSVLGTVKSEVLLRHYHNSWVRYFGHPRRIHVDAGGVFKNCVGNHNTVIYP